MKKIVLIFAVILLAMAACNKSDDNSSAEQNVVSDDGSVQFEDLMVLLNVKVTDTSYLVVKSIDSVNIFVNTSFWAKISSNPVDTAVIQKYTVGNMFLTKNKLNYLIVASQDIDDPNYNTAGEFANYLNSLYDLQAGEYACFIESFKVTFNDNTTRKYYPYIYKPFRVEENSRSAYVGEIELNLNQK